MRCAKQKASLPRNILPDYERDLAETRLQLGEIAFRKAWTKGRSMTLEQARTCALEAKVRITDATKVETPV